MAAIPLPGLFRAVPALLHAAAQDLVGRDQHHADDEGHGEGADEALAHARLAVLLLGVHCGDKRAVRQRRACAPTWSSSGVLLGSR